MAKISKQQLKKWFQNFLKPIQEQFWNWMDSYWHKDEKIPQSSIENWDEFLSSLVTKSGISFTVYPTWDGLPVEPADGDLFELTTNDTNIPVNVSGADIAQPAGKYRANGGTWYAISNEVLLEEVLELLQSKMDKDFNNAKFYPYEIGTLYERELGFSSTIVINEETSRAALMDITSIVKPRNYLKYSVLDSYFADNVKLYNNKDFDRRYFITESSDLGVNVIKSKGVDYTQLNFLQIPLVEKIKGAANKEYFLNFRAKSNKNQTIVATISSLDRYNFDTIDIKIGWHDYSVRLANPVYTYENSETFFDQLYLIMSFADTEMEVLNISVSEFPTNYTVAHEEVLDRIEYAGSQIYKKTVVKSFDSFPNDPQEGTIIHLLFNDDLPPTGYIPIADPTATAGFWEYDGTNWVQLLTTNTFKGTFN